MQQKAQDKFQKAFCFFRKKALDQGLVYNLVDSPAELCRPMFKLGAEHDQLEKCETIRAGFPLQKDRGRSFSKASTRAYVSSSPSLARPFIINSSNGTRIAQLGGLPRKGLRRHRPEDPPLAHLRLWPSAPIGSACRRSLAASVERCWLPGAFDPDQGGVRSPCRTLPDKAQFLFEMVEDVDSWDCLMMCASINARFSLQFYRASLRPAGRV